MNINQPLFLTLLTTVSMITQAHSSIKNFKHHHKEPSLQAIVDFLQDNHLNHNLCSKIVYEFSVKKKQQAHSDHMDLFIGQLAHIAHECEQAKNNRNIHWINHFGFPIKDTIEVKDGVKRSGIAGDLTISLDPENKGDRATITLTLTKKDHYDEEIWLKILHIAIRYTELLEEASLIDKPEEALKKLGYPFDSIFYNEELETSLSVTFDETPSSLKVGFTHT